MGNREDQYEDGSLILRHEDSAKQYVPDPLARLPISGSLDLSQIKLTEALVERLLDFELHKVSLEHQGRETHKIYQYGVRGLYGGVSVVILGALLSLCGISGAVDFQIHVLGFSQKISNAAPGVVLMFIGMLIVYCTRPLSVPPAPAAHAKGVQKKVEQSKGDPKKVGQNKGKRDKNG